jgi:hypothetical protein
LAKLSVATNFGFVILVPEGLDKEVMDMRKPRFLVLISLVLIAAASRLIPHPPNMTPIAAVALFGGAYFSDKWLAFLVPLTALFLSDLALGFYHHMEIVYLSFAFIVAIGLWLHKHRGALPIAGAVLVSSVLFFVITNFGVWALDALYPKTWYGLVACYVAAIPFFRNALLGDLLYTGVLFGSFALLERLLPVLRGSVATKAALPA